jgi:aspartyl-tRNA(Asn)/glutamyl-tRNA(Gln) amidotransferase subunit A
MAEKQPLHGLPVAVKDLYDTAGVRTTAASAQWRDRVPTTDAVVVQRLHAAGSVLMGKANLDEFAYNFTSETSVFGASRNPWNPACSPGWEFGGRQSRWRAACVSRLSSSDTGELDPAPSVVLRHRWLQAHLRPRPHRWRGRRSRGPWTMQGR